MEHKLWVGGTKSSKPRAETHLSGHCSKCRQGQAAAKRGPLHGAPLVTQEAGPWRGVPAVTTGNGNCYSQHYWPAQKSKPLIFKSLVIGKLKLNPKDVNNPACSQ